MNNATDGLRRFPRKRFGNDVYVLDDAGFGFVLEATDVSRGGVFLKTALLLDEGEACFVRFQLGEGLAVNARGHVCRTNMTVPSAHPPGFAIRFDYLDEGSRQALERFTSPPLHSALS
ncbi:MAG: PilZ domain-containing protein [Bradymonadales bacterium]|nr:PilZ domain-containing protein [Bradymonadales bacterium]